MKYLITLVFALLFNTMYAQRIVTQIDDNLYTVSIKSGNIKQAGFYTEVDGHMVAHGTWILKSDNAIITKGIFDKGILQEITVYENNVKKTYTKTDLEINRLKSKIYKLENMLLTSNQ